MIAHPPLPRPLRVGGLTLKNSIMFPPLPTGYEERHSQKAAPLLSHQGLGR